MDVLRRNTDYALRVMVNLAKRHGAGPVSARELAGEEEVPYQLACKLMQMLCKGGFVASCMGPKGGFSLSRDPSQITILEVVEAIQGPIRLNRCLLGRDACRGRSYCPIRAKLGELQEQVSGYLSNATVGELAEMSEAVDSKKTRTSKGGTHDR